MLPLTSQHSTSSRSMSFGDGTPTGTGIGGNEYVAPITPSIDRRGAGGFGGAGGNLQRYIVRAFQTTHMDFEYALSLMWNLVYSPKNVYKTTECRKDIKNQWARDDPAFLVVTVALNLAVNLLYCLFFGVRSVGHFFGVLFFSLVVAFFLVGALVATAGWLFANRQLSHQSLSRSNVPKMEWQYAFDIHCNAYFPFFLLTSVLQLVLYPVLWRPNIVSVFASNALYGFSFCYYVYVTFLGYNILHLRHTERLMYPATAIVVFFTLSFILGFNPTRAVTELYFGSRS